MATKANAAESSTMIPASHKWAQWMMDRSVKMSMSVRNHDLLVMVTPLASAALSACLLALSLAGSSR